MLCDALNRAGYEAYIGTGVLNPELTTPRFTQEVISLHKIQGLEPIVVYPEVVSGNPLGGDVVARYILNTPGFLIGGKDYGEEDIMFSFSKGLLMPGMPEEHIMFLQPVDLGVFKLPDDPGKRIAGKVCYYQGRSGTGLDKSTLPPDAVEITASYPATWERLVEIFQTCEFFYSSATTALSAEAALCGCIGVVIPGEGAPLNFSAAETGNYGVAWGSSPQEIERARETLPLVKQSMEKQEVAFWTALDLFIETTQRAAARTRAAKLELGIAKRLDMRNQMALTLQALATVVHRYVPTIGVVVVDMQSHKDLLARTLDSIAACEGGAVSIVPMVVSDSAAVPAAVNVVQCRAENHIDAINQAILESDCEWVLVMRAGEEFIPSGMLMTSLKLAKMSDYHAVFADEIVRFGHDSLELSLRPDLNLDLLLSLPAGFARHWLLRRDSWQGAGGFATDHANAFEFHFILKLIESFGLEGLGHISEPLLIIDHVPPQDIPQERIVIEQHLHQRGYANALVNAAEPGCYQLDYGHSETPLVSILIVVDGLILHAQRCIDRLLEATQYDRYEILLLDRGNQDHLTREWLNGIDQLGAAQLRVLRFAGDESLAVIRNHAAMQAHGSYLLFLDACTAVTDKDWLQQLLNHVMRPEVGCVGARLIGGDGQLRQAGLVLGLGGVVGEGFQRALAEPGYRHRLAVDQNCSALSDSCLIVSRELFIAMDGFDETLLPWEGVDLCLKVSREGYLNVWAPRACLFISDAQSLPCSAVQEDLMYERWLPVLAHDPAYNSNLSLAPDSAFKLARTAWQLPNLIGVKSPPKILVHVTKKAVDGQSRVIQPFNRLLVEGQIDGIVLNQMMSVVELERFAPDVVLVQRYVDEAHIESMRRMKTFSKAFRVYELDRYLPDTPMPGFNSANYGPQILDALKKSMGFMDRVVVSSEVLAQVFEDFNSDIRVLQTRLDPGSWAGLISKRQACSKPRIGLSARGTLPSDSELLADVVITLANEVDWVFIGSCPPHLRPFMHQVCTDVDEGYPARLASLNLDLALVPLQNTLLNRCRSNERLLEFGYLGIPVIASDLQAHRGDLPVTLVHDGINTWMDAVRAHTNDLHEAQKMGDALQQRVRSDWMLDGPALDVWRDIWLPS